MSHPTRDHHSSLNSPPSPRPEIRRFPVSEVLAKIRQAIAKYPPAMLFDLAARGFNSPFEQLVSCLISIRTRDEVSLLAALRVLDKARTPQSLLKLSFESLRDLITPATFPEQKASRLLQISHLLVESKTPIDLSDFDSLMALPGVGPKCANLVLGIASGIPAIGVDIHVHRITNRWGYIKSGSPEKSMDRLKAVLPQKHWVEINELLVPFGKHICTGEQPHCSTCPVLKECRQVGVTSHR